MASTKVMKRRPSFDRAGYRADAKDLIRANPEMAADSMTKLAAKKRNQDEELTGAEEATTGLIAFLGSMVVMGLAGVWNGRLKARRDTLIADWEAEGASSVGASLTDASEPWDHELGVRDPMNIFFVPKLMALPILFGTVSLIAAATRKKNQSPGWFEKFAMLSATTSFGYVIASSVSGMVYDRHEKQLAKENINSVAAAANGAAPVAVAS